MREISREPQTHEFILKALREACGELVEEFERTTRREAFIHPDGEWSIAQVAAHVADNERVCGEYVDAMLSRRSPRLEPVNFDALAEERGERGLDAARSAYRYAHMRQELMYSIYGISRGALERTGEHPYRGTLSVLQLLRELHLHDLEHLWQVRALREQLLAGRPL
ncbi:MAG: DinB family protein [Dehalococcoidia bacterium]